jgi:mevalonate kinase
LLIADTGISASTKIAVSDVRSMYDNQRQFTEKKIEAIGELVMAGRKAIENNQIIELGNILNQNHQLLQDLTVSSPALDALVETARNAGALGAKLTGGGRGGNMISLVTPDSLVSVRKSLLAAGAVRVYETIVR